MCLVLLPLLLILLTDLHLLLVLFLVVQEAPVLHLLFVDVHSFSCNSYPHASRTFLSSRGTRCGPACLSGASRDDDRIRACVLPVAALLESPGFQRPESSFPFHLLVALATTRSFPSRLAVTLLVPLDETTRGRTVRRSPPLYIPQLLALFPS